MVNSLETLDQTAGTRKGARLFNGDDMSDLPESYDKLREIGAKEYQEAIQTAEGLIFKIRSSDHKVNAMIEEYIVNYTVYLIEHRAEHVTEELATIFHCRAKAGTKNGVALNSTQINACMYAETQLHELAKEM